MESPSTTFRFRLSCWMLQSCIFNASSCKTSRYYTVFQDHGVYTSYTLILTTASSDCDLGKRHRNSPQLNDGNNAGHMLTLAFKADIAEDAYVIKSLGAPLKRNTVNSCFCHCCWRGGVISHVLTWYLNPPSRTWARFFFFSSLPFSIFVQFYILLPFKPIKKIIYIFTYIQVKTSPWALQSNFCFVFCFLFVCL